MLRKSNLELLRIVSMLMIIISHFFVHGNWGGNDFVTNIIIKSLGIGEIGVVCFVLISGYFLVKQEFSLIKIAKLVVELWIYGAGILLIVYLTGISEITKKYFYGSLLPFYSLNWFARAYLMLYLLFPLFNCIIKRCSKEKLTMFILAFGIFWTVMPIRDLYEHGNSRITVCYLYFIGAYLRLYGNELMSRVKFAMLSSLVSYGLIVYSVYYLCKYREAISIYNGRESCMLSLNSCLVIICGIGLFILFFNLKISYIESINNLAKTVFGTYLIHDNPMIKGWIWHEVIKSQDYYSSPYLIPYAVICAIAILLICGCIDWLRIKFIEEPFFKKNAYFLESLQNKVFRRTGRFE